MSEEHYLGSFCPECGPNVGVDEYGLCASCGCTAVGVAVDKQIARIAELEAENARLRDKLLSPEHPAVEVLRRERDEARALAEHHRVALEHTIPQRDEARAACVVLRAALGELPAMNGVPEDIEDDVPVRLSVLRELEKVRISPTVGFELLTELKSLREDWHRKCDALCSLEARLEKAEADAQTWSRAHADALKAADATCGEYQAQIEAMRAALEWIRHDGCDCKVCERANTALLPSALRLYRNAVIRECADWIRNNHEDEMDVVADEMGRALKDTETSSGNHDLDPVLRVPKGPEEGT